MPSVTVARLAIGSGIFIDFLLWLLGWPCRRGEGECCIAVCPELRALWGTGSCLEMTLSQNPGTSAASLGAKDVFDGFLYSECWCELT